MKVQFNFPRTIDGVHYRVGTHELPENKKGHWFLDALINAGEAVILDVVETVIEKSKEALEEKLMEVAPIGEKEVEKAPEKTKRSKGK